MDQAMKIEVPLIQNAHTQHLKGVIGYIILPRL